MDQVQDPIYNNGNWKKQADDVVACRNGLIVLYIKTMGTSKNVRVIYL